ncbi:nuclear transport factor 2 family protein [Chryseobacterium antibioticum]|uniref:Nuclear transport factor 2 family protein n=1 Tax=Chryseobacterium pyrolae TaxID=2987481 RepID=A0ABT2INU7_9FLAO|nr:nuclear transport factor 2 family protein [Chryseobacterium pyrolae]MCT2409867.1 nuclear transport factor 2 family protein [Chryseobacterium pyrolae]
MTLEILKTREELRNLIDAYASLGDEKKIAEQMELFTLDVTYKAYMGDFLAGDTTGRKKLENEFNSHASQVKTYFTMNGQHTVEIDGDTATGTSFSQIKMIREGEGKDIMTDYSVKYDDKYVFQNGKWLIKDRIGYFIIVETRPFL